MAVAVTAVAGVGSTGNARGWLLTCLDADTAISITHGLAFASDAEADQRMVVILEPTHIDFYVALLRVSTRTATTATLTKAGAGGTGAGATGLCRIWVKLQNRGE